jgi:hypothetical protein
MLAVAAFAEAERLFTDFCRREASNIVLVRVGIGRMQATDLRLCSSNRARTGTLATHHVDHVAFGQAGGMELRRVSTAGCVGSIVYS